MMPSPNLLLFPGASDPAPSVAQWFIPPAPAPLIPGTARPEQKPAAVPSPAGPPAHFAPAIPDEMLEQAAKHLRSIGTVNILIAGQTGVGKSTLLNSVFGEDFAKTALGEPVTQHAEWFSSPDVPLRIMDSRGLEAKDYSATLNAVRGEVEASRAQRSARNQLHIAWVCIAAPSSRVQECEIDLVRMCNRYDIPVVVVLTKDDDDVEFAEVVADVLASRKTVVHAIVRVRALAKARRPPLGLDNVVAATFAALPDAHRAAFAAAQKVNRDLNRTLAEEYVTAALSASVAAAVVPIPFADVAALAPIQGAMLIGISKAFGLQLERGQATQLISALLGCMAVTLAGAWAAGNALKLIPGAGSVAGAAVNAALAGAVTRTLGKTYIRFLYGFIEAHGRLPAADEIVTLLPTLFRSGEAFEAGATPT